MNRKKIVVIGSGTAGLVTALIIKNYFKNYEVTVVSSSKKGKAQQNIGVIFKILLV